MMIERKIIHTISSFSCFLSEGTKKRPSSINLKKNKEDFGTSDYFNRKKDRIEAKRKKDELETQAKKMKT